MTTNNKLITVIEITDSLLKLVQASRGKSGLNISMSHIFDIRGRDDNQIAKTLNKLSKQPSFRLNQSQMITVIPRQNILFRYLSLPSETKEEIQQMTELQIGKLIPYSREEVAVQAIPLSKNEEGYSQVLAVVVLKEEIDRLVHIFQKAELTPQIMTMSSQGIHVWYALTNYSQTSDQEKATMLINLDHVHTELCFCVGNQVVYSRTVRPGISQLDVRDPSRLLRQIDLTVSSFLKTEVYRDIGQILLISSNREMETLVHLLKDEYQLPVDLVAAQAGIPIEKGFRWPELILGNDSLMTAPIGLVLADSKELLNFMPKEVEEEKQAKKKMVALIRCGVGLAVVFILAMLGFFVEPFKQGKYLEEVKFNVMTTQKKVKTIQEKQKLVKSMRSIFDEKVLLAEVIQELYNLVPSETSLTNMKINGRNKLILQGFTYLGSEVNDLQRDMVSSNQFQNVVLDYVNKRKRKDKEITYFKITCELGS